MFDRIPPFAQTTANGGALVLPQNKIWNVPSISEGDQGFKIEVGPGPHSPLRSLTALVMSTDGRVFGIRKSSELTENGASGHFVRISLAGQKRRCFTSSRLFQRPDGSLCEVAVFLFSWSKE